MLQTLVSYTLNLNLLTYIDRVSIVTDLKDLLEELRTFRETLSHQSSEEIYARAFVSSVKTMLEKKTYSLENVRYISGKILEFLQVMEMESKGWSSESSSDVNN